MKITFFLTTIDNAAGTERAIITQANSLVASGAQVDIHSVYRTTGAPAFPLDESVSIHYWVDGTTLTDASGSCLGTDVDGYGHKPSRLIPREWDDQFNLLTDVVAGRIIPNIDSDIIVTTTPALSLLAGSLSKPKTVVLAQEHRATMRRGQGFTPLRLAASQIDCIVSLTDASNDWLFEKLAGAGVRLETIPNVLPDLFRPQSTTEEKMVIAAGRFAPGKQFSQLIDAFSRISSQHPDWLLRIYGHGPLEDSLKNQAVRLNVSHAVQIVPPVKNLELEWPKGSILALTSRMEGLPLVIMEAAGAGVPTISYDCQTGPAELIDDGRSGILVPLNDVESMALALSKLMGDDNLRFAMGQAAKESIGDYAPSKIEAQWSRLYSELLDDAKRLPSRAERNAERFAASLETADELAGDMTLDQLPDGKASSKKPAAQVVSAFELEHERILRTNRLIVENILLGTNVKSREIEGYHGYRKVVAVAAQDRYAVLEEIARLSDPTVAVDFFKGQTRISPRLWCPAEEAPPAALADADVVRIFGRHSDAHGLVEIGADSGVDLEFWGRDEETGTYLAPRHNRTVDSLEKVDFLSPGQPATPVRNVWSRTNFPIDVVYTWVDGNDTAWMKRKASFIPNSSDAHDQAVSAARFTNRDELRYSIRSLRRYAPWVRNIFVVTDNQTPEWLDEESDVRVVSHSEIFPDETCLPTFNSHAIETALHRIPDLAEHFLYCNDDTVLLRQQVPETYFTPNGLAKFFPSPVKINYLSGEAEPHIAAAINNRDIIRGRFGVEITQSMLHTPHPHRKSVLAQIEHEQRDVIEATRSHRFRHPDDVSLLSSLGQYYGFCLEKYVQGSIRYTYVGLGRPGTEEQLAGLVTSGRLDVATFGESNVGYENPDETDRLLRCFFESKYPVPSRDEHTDSVRDQ
ncbi:stealth conserved region 3 domain-containing protein [Paeniglutamicibacter sp. R2-26]|uniref:stealth conserved region 3 domain-containing protein n=1 Tax=Paeniglutamicibacter sp. R2-26 TaxID=3144417 RepID=UPI003EE52338